MTTNIQTLKVAVHLCVKVRTAGAICPMLDSLSSRMMHKAVLVLETVCTLILKTKLPPMSSPLSTAMPDFDIGPALVLPPAKMVLKIRPDSFDGINDLTGNNNN